MTVLLYTVTTETCSESVHMYCSSRLSCKKGKKCMEEGRRSIVIPYTPRELQKHLRTNLARFNVVVCHRRFGKTVFAINELII